MKPLARPATDSRVFETLYRQHYLEHDKRQVIIGIFFWIIGMLAFIFSDYAVFQTSREFVILLLLRGGFAALSVLVIFYLWRRTKEYGRFDLTVQWWSLACVLMIICITISRPVVQPSGFVINLVAVTCLYIFVPNRLSVRLLAPLLLTAFDLGIATFGKTEVTPMLFQALTFTYLSINILGFVFSARLDSFRRKEFLAHEDERSTRAELEHLASTDPLTGILNRRRLLEQASEAFYRFRRYQRPFSLLLMDMDGFKMVNDTFGHQQGDQVLVQFTQMVHAAKRESDVFGRMGGDEFCLVLPETVTSQAMTLGERILARCTHIEPNGKALAVQVTVSIGVSQVLESDTTIDQLFARADAALYNAKNKGRNRCEMV